MDFLLSFYSGKSTLLTTISERDIPIPDHIDIFHLTEEIRASDKTPLQCVMEVDNERYVLFFIEQELWFYFVPQYQLFQLL